MNEGDAAGRAPDSWRLRIDGPQQARSTSWTSVVVQSPFLNASFSADGTRADFERSWVFKHFAAGWAALGANAEVAQAKTDFIKALDAPVGPFIGLFRKNQVSKLSRCGGPLFHPQSQGLFDGISQSI